MFINEVIISLFARTYKPDHVIMQPGSAVPSVMFIMKGSLAICEPNGDPFCILGEGSYIGEFQILKNVPWFFKLQTTNEESIETRYERQNGKQK